MSIDGDAVSSRDSSETTNVTSFDSNLDVTGHLTAKRMRFGSDKCNIGIETVTKGSFSYPEMYITLPNTYHGTLKTQKYRMRSIIEAIQEINRRTATFNCNMKFDEAKGLFDVKIEDPYNQFACNEHEDGLPAASGQFTNINELEGDFHLKIVYDGYEPYITESIYPIGDLVNNVSDIINSDAGLSEWCDKYNAIGIQANIIFNRVDCMNNEVVYEYRPPPIEYVTCMQELNENGNESLYAFGDGTVVRCALHDDEKDEIIWRPYDKVLCNNNVSAISYSLTYITERYIILIDTNINTNLSTKPFIIFDRQTYQINSITSFDVNGVNMDRIIGLQRIFHNKYAILNLQQINSTNYAICLMNMNDPTKVIPIIESSEKAIKFRDADYISIDNRYIAFILNLKDKTSCEFDSDDSSTWDSSLYKVIFDTEESTIIDVRPFLHYVTSSSKYYTIAGSIFHRIDDNSLAIVSLMYISSNGHFISGIISSSDIKITTNDDVPTITYENWSKGDQRYEIVIPSKVGTKSDNESIPNIQYLGKTADDHPRWRMANHNFNGAYSWFSQCFVDSYNIHPFRTASIDENNFYFMITSYMYTGNVATLIHGTIEHPLDLEKNNDSSAYTISFKTYTLNDESTVSYTKDSFVVNSTSLLAYDSEHKKLYKTYHMTSNNNTAGIYAAEYSIYTDKEPKYDDDENTVIIDEYGSYRYNGIETFNPTGISNPYYIPFNGKLYAGYNQRSLTKENKKFVPIVRVQHDILR